MVDATNASGGINGRQIELVIADDQTKEAKALSEVKRMIEDKDIMAIVGGASSPISLAMVPAIEEAGISYISFGGSSSIIADKKWAFKIPPQERFLVRTLLSDAQKKGIKKIGIIRVNNDYGKSGADTFVKEAPDFGIEITAVEQINPDDKDAKVQISKIMGAGVDALGLWTSTPSESAVVAKGFYELGYAGKYPIYSGPAVSSSEFVKLEPNGSTGVIFPTYKFVVAEQLPQDDPQYEVVNEFLKLYSEKYTERSQFPANGADAWNLLKDAITRAGDNVTRQTIRDNLESASGVVGQLGTYNMSPTDHNGLDESGFVNVRIDNGQFVLN
jgi:branched-chain amino acid transport system substrate-binding protein